MGETVATTQRRSDHGKCSTHKVYLLTCRQYDELVAEANGQCQICGFPAEQMPQRRLYIDHDYRGFWAVRGLLCIRCNSALGDKRIGRQPVGTSSYLRNAWFERMHRERGISPNPRFRPPTGVCVVDPDGAQWSPDPRGGRRWSSDQGQSVRNWRELFRTFGPNGLRAVAEP